MARKEKVTEIVDYNCFKTNMRKNKVWLADVKKPEWFDWYVPGILRRLIEGMTVKIEIVGYKDERDVLAKVWVGNTCVNDKLNEHIPLLIYWDYRDGPYQL